MKQPVISIVVPVYNIENYIEQCIESIVNQSYSNLDIILIDDGSEDTSSKICDAYAERDCRIRVVHKENGGLVSARKAGMEIAQGEYIFNVDGDDWIAKDMVEIMVNHILEDDVDVVQCGHYCVGNRGYEHVQYVKEQSIIEVNYSTCLEKWLSNQSVISSNIVNKMFKTSLFKECYEKVPNERGFGEDQIFYIHLLHKAKSVKCITENLYYYRLRECSLSHLKNKYELMCKHNDLLLYISSLIREIGYKVDIKYITNWMVREQYDVARNFFRAQDCNIPMYHFEVNELIGKKIVVYGAGIIGNEFISYISKYEHIEIVAWVDKNGSQCESSFRKIFSPDIISNLNYDYIVVAIKSESTFEEIKTWFQENCGIDKEKVLWSKPKNIMSLLDEELKK